MKDRASLARCDVMRVWRWCLSALTVAAWLAVAGCSEDGSSGSPGSPGSSCQDDWDCDYAGQDWCSGDTRHTCERATDGCLDEKTTSCTHGCSGGSCKTGPSCQDDPDCDYAGQKWCSGATRHTCEQGSGGCLDEKTESCAHGCSGGTCAACADDPDCPFTGKSWCSGNTRHTCQADSDGCLDEKTESCAHGCSGGACATCSDDPSCDYSGEKWCSGDTRHWCVTGADGCLDDKKEACAADEECESGTCLDACECSSGPCCDGCWYEDEWTECDDLEQFDCTASCGGDVERRVGTRYCSGHSSSCTGDTDWGGWYTFMDCPGDWACESGSDYGSCKKYKGSNAKLTLKLTSPPKAEPCGGCGNIYFYPKVYYSVNCNFQTSGGCSVGAISGDDLSDTITVPSGSINIYYRLCAYVSSSAYQNNCCYAQEVFKTKCDGTPCFCSELKMKTYDMGCQKTFTF